LKYGTNIRPRPNEDGEKIITYTTIKEDANGDDIIHTDWREVIYQMA
jgi:hypothetical protein